MLAAINRFFIIIIGKKPVQEYTNKEEKKHWANDGNGSKNSIDALLEWLVDEKNSSRYFGKTESSSKDKAFEKEDGDSKMIIAKEISKYIYLILAV